MRLIDADTENARLLDFIAQHDSGIQYAIEHKDMTILEVIFFDYFNEQKTVFHLESTIGQLEEKALEHAINGQQYGEDGYDIHEAEEQGIKQGIEIAIKILKSATNATNGG